LAGYYKEGSAQRRTTFFGMNCQLLKHLANSGYRPNFLHGLSCQWSNPIRAVPQNRIDIVKFMHDFLLARLNRLAG